MAGTEGFEPPNGGTRTHCLTTWRRPNILVIYAVATPPIGKVLVRGPLYIYLVLRTQTATVLPLGDVPIALLFYPSGAGNSS